MRVPVRTLDAVVDVEVPRAAAASLAALWSRCLAGAAAPSGRVRVDAASALDPATGSWLASTLTQRGLEAGRGRLLMARASAVSDSRGRVLGLVGPARSGRTTAALHLARHCGLAYVSDDTLAVDAALQVRPHPGPVADPRSGRPAVLRSPDALGLPVCPDRLTLGALVLLDRQLPSPTRAAVSPTRAAASRTRAAAPPAQASASTGPTPAPTSTLATTLTRLDDLDAVVAVLPHLHEAGHLPRPLACLRDVVAEVGVHMLRYREIETAAPLLTALLERARHGSPTLLPAPRGPGSAGDHRAGADHGSARDQRAAELEQQLLATGVEDCVVIDGTPLVLSDGSVIRVERVGSCSGPPAPSRPSHLPWEV